MADILLSTQGEPADGTIAAGTIVLFSNSGNADHMSVKRSDNTVVDLEAQAATSFVKITDADSPYTLLASTDVLSIDATNGNVTVNLLALTLTVRCVSIIRTDTSGNTVTLDGNGSEKILDKNGVAQNTITLGIRSAVNLAPDTAGTIWFRS